MTVWTALTPAIYLSLSRELGLTIEQFSDLMDADRVGLSRTGCLYVIV